AAWGEDAGSFASGLRGILRRHGEIGPEDAGRYQLRRGGTHHGRSYGRNVDAGFQRRHDGSDRAYHVCGGCHQTILGTRHNALKRMNAGFGCSLLSTAARLLATFLREPTRKSLLYHRGRRQILLKPRAFVEHVKFQSADALRGATTARRLRSFSRANST